VGPHVGANVLGAGVGFAVGRSDGEIDGRFVGIAVGEYDMLHGKSVHILLSTSFLLTLVQVNPAEAGTPVLYRFRRCTP